ncbi:MAG TPA: hypothetical protein VE053_06910 [Allosphingosinicella sp.]|nr:hypothetical protein [Allosphingosinicella sp.]
MPFLEAVDQQQAAQDRLTSYFSDEAEAARRQRFDDQMAELKCIREELGVILGVAAKE